MEIKQLTVEEIKKRVGRNIKVCRAKNDMTQGDLAEKLGCTKQQVSRWEKGHNIPQGRTMVKINKLFKTDIMNIYKEDY